MTPETRTAAALHAQTQSPREACGLVVIRHGKEVYYPCRNISEQADRFVMSPEDYAAAEAHG
ncbi:MAG: Mov34/MPN/PAD-1 family protein, partial [Acidocella sp.]|nr:Mov34/MPN/PAD-1 family protein [Acidocella sp.]